MFLICKQTFMLFAFVGVALWGHPSARSEEVPLTVVGEDTTFIPPKTPPPPKIFLDRSAEAAPRRPPRRAPAAKSAAKTAAPTQPAAPSQAQSQSVRTPPTPNSRQPATSSVKSNNPPQSAPSQIAPRSGPLQRLQPTKLDNRSDRIQSSQSQSQAEAPPLAPEDGELAPLPDGENAVPSPPAADASDTADLESIPVAEDAPPPVSSEETNLESTESSTSTASVPDYVYDRVPLYKKHIPQWGFEMAATLEPNFNFVGNPNDDLTGISLQWDYQPAFLQAIGVLGIGPSLGVYSDFKMADSNQSDILSGIWQIGGQAHYQARFFREQILVPMVGYVAEYVNYRFLSGQSGRTLIKGPVFGAWLLLNMFEPGAAGDFYSNFGVSRSYLIAEFRMLSGSDSNLTVTGRTVFFGLRIEY